MDARYKEKHSIKNYDFERFTNGISEEEPKKKKHSNWKSETEFEQDLNGDFDPIKSDSKN